MKKVLTIAGSDCSGGAGIQADLKTITAHKLYGMSVITALTAQNTTGVKSMMEAEPEFVADQLDAVFTDIYPDSVKIGMVSNSRIIRVIADKLSEYGAKNIVVDPVMVSTSGHRLMCEEAMDAVMDILLPMGDVITPNIPEAQVLCGFEIHTEEDMIKAAGKLAQKYKGAILIKGGHLENDATDLLYQDGQIRWFRGKRVENPNTHGTGCTLSSAIACNLAQGFSVADSVANAKAYLTGALEAMLDLGAGSGPLNHVYAL
nr:bifunctional hydroxymethylpyrimidine kinase/phosphomethylpyrimidine kinase [uncultured Blautia sp.]